MLVVFVLLLLISVSMSIILNGRYRRLTSNNWLSDAYSTFNKKVYNFHDIISRQEQKYIIDIISKYNPSLEFQNGGELSPYSFSISIDKKSGIVNLTRVNIGSVSRDISANIVRLLDHINVKDNLCLPGFKYYGIGWDVIEGIIKFYTLSHDRRKIECHVFKVERNESNEIATAKFNTKKTYDVGNNITVMLKNGKAIDQINTNRKCVTMENSTANAWINKLQKLGFILDTMSDYEGKINLYFD